MMSLQGIATIILVLLVSACGAGKDQLDLPQERPKGSVSGKIMDGSFRDSQINIYSLEDLFSRKHLAKGTVDENGDFSIELQAPDQPVLVEISGGHYQEIENNSEVVLAEGQVLTAPFYYVSGKTYHIDITLLSHMVTALLFNSDKSGAVDESHIADVYQKLSDIFQVDIKQTSVSVDTAGFDASVEFPQDKLYRLLLAAFSKLSGEISEHNETELYRQYNSISLAQIIYDDILAEGKLNGMSRSLSKADLIPMEWGKQKITPDFYRSDLAGALSRSLSFQSLPIEKQNLMQHYNHQLANQQSTFFVSTDVETVSPEALPTVRLLSDLPTQSSQMVDLEFAIGGFRAARSVSFYLDDSLITESIYPTLPVLQLDTTQFADGVHELKVEAYDIADGFTEKIIFLGIDNTAPALTITSATISKTKQYRLTGTYQEPGSNLSGIKANGVLAVVNNSQEWFVDLQLLAGSNNISIEIEDNLGNAAQYQYQVFVDLNAPIVNSNNAHSEAKFSTGKGQYHLGKLQDNNLSESLYIEIDKLSLQGMAVQKNILDDASIPYFSFSVIDPTLEGSATSLDDINVSLRIETNQMISKDWQRLSPVDEVFVIPLTTEYLGVDWDKTLPEDEILIRVRAVDLAGNESEKSFDFRASFFVPVPDVAVIEDNEADSWLNMEFTQRQQLSDSQFAVFSYQMVNTTGKHFFIKSNLNDEHVISQQYEKLQRENLVSLKTTEQWRVGTISNIAVACPQATGDWFVVDHLFNFTINNGWVEMYPSEQKSVPEYKPSDNPQAPGTSAWQLLPAFDNEHLAYELSDFNETLRYEYDYITDLSIAGSTQPALLKSWQKLTANNDPVLCPDISQIEYRLLYKYNSEPGYPRNTLTSWLEEYKFNTIEIRIYDEDGTLLSGNADWVEIPPLHHMRIVKIVKTPKIEIYNDEVVASPEAVTSYDEFQYDKKLTMQVKKNLDLIFLYNPLDISTEILPSKPVSYHSGSRYLTLQR